MQFPATVRALRHRNFQLFFGGQLISLIGTWMQSVAQSWLVYRMSGSSALLGAVGFAGQFPVLLFAPLGGIVADRYGKRAVIVATQTASMLLAFALALSTLTGSVQIWHVFALSLSLGIVNAFDIPARQSFMVEMVGKQDLMNAIALNSSMFNASRVIGPAVAGILVAGIGEGWCFFANGVSYFAVLAGLSAMRMAPRIGTTQTDSPVKSLIEGFRFVRTHTPVHAIMILAALTSLTAMSYTVLMPVFASRVLHGGPRALGWLMGSAGVGALVGALVLASRTDLKGLARWLASAAASFGALLAVFSLSRSLWLSAAILAPAGFAMIIQNGSSNTLIQSMSPDPLRGRIVSLYSMVFTGFAPIGALLAGFAAERYGAPITVRVAGIFTMLAAGGFWLVVPSIHREAHALIASQHEGG